jgi:hypothetical protein
MNATTVKPSGGLSPPQYEPVPAEGMALVDG